MSRIRTARSESKFETTGIWDDTIPWGRLQGKYLVDDNGQVRAVRRVNFARGTVSFKDGEEVYGWRINENWSSLHGTKDEAEVAAGMRRR